MEQADNYIKKDLSLKLTQPKNKFKSSVQNLGDDLITATLERKSKMKKKKKEDDQRMMREDPDAYFKKLKAMIKLKAVKKFQEDQDKKVE